LLYWYKSTDTDATAEYSITLYNAVIFPIEHTAEVYKAIRDASNGAVHPGIGALIVP
jgi:hypothetical protein